jgi:hypothetical protein
MNRTAALLLALLPCLFGCTTTVVYRPADKADAAEFARDLVDVYPGDVRSDINLYTNVGVGWAGIIKTSKATVAPDGTIHAVTTFDHRYYDWQQKTGVAASGQGISVSPRGEGIFQTETVFRPKEPGAGLAQVEKSLSTGSLAIVYGVPQTVADGTVVLKYRYIRVLEPGDFSTSEFDYGRFGGPVRYLGDTTPAPFF